jgi:para-aminobenzoate synthetase/4-amino-4-deoxychorismate lyase
MRHDLPFLVLDDSRSVPGRLRVFAKCRETIAAHDQSELGQAFARIEAAREVHHVAGYLSYELGYALEPKLFHDMPEARELPLLWFGVFEECTIIEGAAADEFLAARIRGRAYAGPLAFSQSEDTYRHAFETVHDYIEAGDIYQANLTFPARFAFAGDPLALFARMRGQALAGHGAYVADGIRHILSFSPELFFEITDGILTSRPMKGTAKRGANAQEDEAARDYLRSSDKERAENLMIVDLIRNDAGRVAKTGSVGVRDLFAVETYPTVLQMVSTVTAALRNGVSAEDLARALFPCGSVTGTPKIRAQEIIRECEASPRGIYCGAIGVFSPQGRADFNVAIRTLTIKDNEGVLGIGGGIVADSGKESEYAECLLKARFYTDERRPLALIETLRFDPNEGFLRLDLHLSRLENSAHALAIPFDENKIRDALNEIAESDTALRVRIELGEGGVLSLATGEIGPETGRWTYAYAKARALSSDPLLRHKITWREFYEDAYALAHRETGCSEVIFLNERGEVTEGSRTNIFARIGGKLVTPPLSSGLLPGILRRELLDSGACVEQVLTQADIASAEKVYFGNSLRGLIEAKPVSV